MDNGLILTAFDAFEACIELSKLYEKNEKDRFVQFQFTSITNAASFNFGRFEKNLLKEIDSFTVFLDDEYENPEKQTFEDVFKKIKEEMARYE